jgi:peptide/nickel transport system substrate-binding protein
MTLTSPVLKYLTLSISIAFGLSSATFAAPQHGIAMYGDPALPPHFVSLPYANPAAPSGGRIVFGERGGFDSLNPYILKGRAPWGVRSHVVESLMGRNWDEPFSLYGLLAESIETGPNREWVEFTLREEAKFSNGDPVTVEDVLWSFETLGTVGHPRYLNSWKKIETATQSGPRSIRFTFNVVDFELPLILGLRPILRKADWDGRVFEESSLDVLTGSGAYVIDTFEPGRFISFKRNPDYWGNALGYNKGRHNVDELRYDYFADGTGVFEAFKAQELSVLREGDNARWQRYDFPAVQSGAIVKDEIHHQRPTGISGWVMNTRNPLFADWRVRDAMIHAFNFGFINETVNGRELPRITSYFSNSVLGMHPGMAEGRVAELLEPFAASLLPGATDGYALPENSTDRRNRKNMRKARELLSDAGWNLQDGVMQNETGQPFEFEILLKTGENSLETAANIFIDALNSLGINPTLSVVDSAQYKTRVTEYSFDMTNYRRNLSLSPGNEQRLYWGKNGVTAPGTRNYMGMDSPAAEAMIDAILSSDTQADFVAATRALDRVLTSGRYVIPIWFQPFSQLAHKAELKFPDTLPIYGDWVGFLPDVWWIEPE